MDVVDIYRFEDKRGMGPWTSDSLVIELYHSGMRMGYSPGFHPGPISDGIKTHTAKREYKFGCRSFADLNKWFPCRHGRAKMCSVMRLVHLRVPKEHVEFGGMQVMYNSNHVLEKFQLDSVRFEEYLMQELKGK